MSVLVAVAAVWFTVGAAVVVGREIRRQRPLAGAARGVGKVAAGLAQVFAVELVVFAVVVIALVLGGV